MRDVFFQNSTMDEDFLCLDELGDNLRYMADDLGEIPDGEKMAINVEDLDEAKIDQLLEAVKVHYTILEEENARLVQLRSLITEKLGVCIQKEIAGNLKTEPRTCPLNLNLTANEEEEEEEDDD